MFILLTDWASSLPNGIRLFGKKLSHGALIFIDTDNGPASFRRWLGSSAGSSSAGDDKLCKSRRHQDQNKLYACGSSVLRWVGRTHDDSHDGLDKVISGSGWALAIPQTKWLRQMTKSSDCVRNECKSERLMAKLL